MSREEAAAKAWHATVPLGDGTFDQRAAENALAAADAYDAAHNVHRVVLDDATVERAARFLIEVGAYGVPWGDAAEDERAEATHIARAVLAAAVKEER